MSDIYQQGAERHLAGIKSATGVDAEYEAAMREYDQEKTVAKQQTAQEQAQKLIADSQKPAPAPAPSAPGKPAKKAPSAGDGLKIPDAGQATEDFQSPVQGMAKGLAVGALKGAENLWNLVNLVDDMSATAIGKETGAGPKGLINPANFASKIPLEDDLVTRGAAKVGEYGLPFLMGNMAASGISASAPAAAKFFAGAATNTLLAASLDPNQERFTDTIVKNYPWMRKVGADLLASKPGDTEIEKRLKNAGEALAFDTGFAGVLALGMKVSKYARMASRAAPELEATGAHAGALPPQTAQGVAEDSALAAQSQKYIHDMEVALPGADVKLKPAEGEVAAGMPAQPAPVFTEQKFVGPQGVEQTQNVVSPEGVEQVASTLSREQNPKVQLSSITGTDSVLTNDAVSQIVESLSEKIKSGRQGTITHDEMSQMGMDYLNARPEEFANLLKNHKPGTPYTHEQFSAIQTFTQATVQDFVEMSAKIAPLKGKSPMDMLPEEMAMISHHQELSDLVSTVLPVYHGAVEMPAQQLRFVGKELESLAVGKKVVGSMMEHIRLAGGIETVLQNADKMNQIVALHGRNAGMSLSSALVKTGGDMEKALSEVALSGLISGPRTSARAAIGGMIYNATREMQRANMALFGPAMGLNMQEWKNARDVFYARMLSMRTSGLEAMSEAYHAIKTGESRVSAFDFSPKEMLDPVYKATSMQKGAFLSKDWMFHMASAAGAKAKHATATLADYSTRLIKGADSLNAAFARRQSYIEDATMEALTEGVEDTATYAYARSMYPTKQMMEKAEGLAREAAYNADYNQLLEGTVLGDWAAKQVGGIDKVISGMPFGKVMVPFMKTGVNDMVQTMETAPIISLVAPRQYAAFQEGGVKRAEALAKMAVGIEAVGGIAALTSFGGVEITGAEPENTEMARALKQRNPGWQANSIKVGGKWVSYDSLGALGKLFSAYANLRELSVHVETDETVRYGHALGAIVMETFTPKQIMEDLPEFIDTVTKMAKDSKEADFANFVAEQAPKFMPASGALRQVRGLTDPNARDTRDAEKPWNTLINTMKNMIPGMSAQLPPMRNIFGEIVHNPQYLGSDILSPFMVSDADADPLTKELQRLGLWNTRFATPPEGQPPVNVTMPERIIGMSIPATIGGGRSTMKLSPFEYDLFVRFSAGINLPKDAFNHENADFADMNPDTYQEFLAVHTEHGKVPTLRQTLTHLINNPSEALGEYADGPQEVRDNAMRLALTLYINKYREIGRSAMAANLKKGAIMKKGLLDRANSLGAEVKPEDYKLEAP